MMVQYAGKLTESGAGEGVAARENGPFLRVHSYRDARGGLVVTAAGFNHAVRALAKDVRRTAGLHTILMLTEATLPDDATAQKLYRIVQETVHNVVKHAGASCLYITFKIEESSFVLVVRDDGNGIPAGSCAQAGAGFEGMASRAGTIGAQLEVRGVPGRGTAVRCVVPL